MKFFKLLVATVFIALTTSLVSLSTASAASFPVFGEKVYVRANGKPTAEVDNFSITNTQRTYTLRVFNGGQNNEFNRVSSAIILLNGTQILGPNDFNQNVGLIERPVTASSTNTLSVELRSKPGSALAIIIEGDNTPPQIVSTPITTAKENDPYRYDVDATDPDPAEVLTFNLLNAPTGMVIDSVTGLIQWTPNFNQAGSHSVTVQVSDEINETDAQSFTINVANTNRVPTITSTPITTGKQNELYSYAVTATDPDNDPLTFSLITAPAGMVINANTGLITWTPDTSGDIPITVAVDDGQGGTDSQSYTLSIAPAITIVITSPVEGETITTDNVLVTGTYIGPVGTGVVVNGIVAFVDGINFYANDIPLKDGINTIEAVVTSPLGTSSQSQVQVTRSGDAPVEVTVTPDEGFLPLSSEFTVFNFSSVDILLFEVDVNNDGFTDYSASNPSDIITHNYIQDGIHLANVTITFTDQSTYTYRHAVNVLSEQSLNLLTSDVFQNFRDALVLGDIQTALKYITNHARQRYQQTLETLQPNLPSVIDTWGPLQHIEVGPGYVIYAINTNFSGATRVFFINFIQDGDGVWRIDSM